MNRNSKIVLSLLAIISILLISSMFEETTTNIVIQSESNINTSQYSSSTTIENGEYNYWLDKCNATSNFTLSGSTSITSINNHLTTLFIDNTEDAYATKSYSSTLSNYTICFWVQVTSNYRVIIKTLSGSTQVYLAYILYGNYVLYTGATTYNVSTISLNSWYFIRIIMDTANHKCFTYVNSSVYYGDTYLSRTNAQNIITYSIGNVGGKIYIDSISLTTSTTANITSLLNYIEYYTLNQIFELNYVSTIISLVKITIETTFQNNTDFTYRILNYPLNSYETITNSFLQTTYANNYLENNNITLSLYKLSLTSIILVNISYNATIFFI